jgi:N-acetylglutamate synthase-like GNAT family acetyltransferase
MTNWTFRTAADEDWPDIAALLQSCNLPLDGAQDHLKHFLLAFENGRLAGVAGIENYQESGLLRSVAVKERNVGLGRELVQRAIEQARMAGLRKLVLLTTTAADYFPRFGFTRISRDVVPMALQASEEFQGACPDSAIVMQLLLQ